VSHFKRRARGPQNEPRISDLARHGLDADQLYMGRIPERATVGSREVARIKHVRCRAIGKPKRIPASLLPCYRSDQPDLSNVRYPSPGVSSVHRRESIFPVSGDQWSSGSEPESNDSPASSGCDLKDAHVQKPSSSNRESSSRRTPARARIRIITGQKVKGEASRQLTKHHTLMTRIFIPRIHLRGVHNTPPVFALKVLEYTNHFVPFHTTRSLLLFLLLRGGEFARFHPHDAVHVFNCVCRRGRPVERQGFWVDLLVPQFRVLFQVTLWG